MATHHRLSKSNYTFMLPLRLDMRDGIRTGLESTINKIRSIFDETELKVLEINSSVDLTETGKKSAREELSTEVKQQFDKVADEVGGYAKNAEQKERDLRKRDPARSGEDRLVSELRGREIRDAFKQLDQAMRIPAWQKAIKDGDVEIIDAVAGAPKAFPLIPEQELAEGLAKRFESLFPTEAKEIAELRHAHRLSLSALETAWTGLREWGVHRGDDLETIKKRAKAKSA